MTNNIKHTLIAIFGSVFLAFSLAPVASANDNPFTASPLDSGYDVVSQTEADDKCGKCGEGKCGESVCGEGEGKCGEGKCGKGEGKCGEGKAKGEGKCGEGESKCGEGKCGGDK